MPNVIHSHQLVRQTVMRAGWLRGRIMRLVVTLTRRFLSEEIQRIIGGLSDTALRDK